jgi:hypothetical protein
MEGRGGSVPGRYLVSMSERRKRQTGKGYFVFFNCHL